MSESFQLIEHEFEVDDHQCSFCKKSYRSAKSLRSHVKCHTGEGYQCKYCLMFCTAPSTLQRHMKTHAEQSSCRCVVCDREFVAPKNLKWHIRAVHGGDVNVLMKSLGEEYRNIDLTPAFQCQFCDKPYAHLKSLRKHVISVHGYKGEEISVTPSTTKTAVNPSPSDSFVFYSDDNVDSCQTEDSTADVFYTCELCPENQMFSTLESVISHMQVHQIDTDSHSSHSQDGQPNDSFSSNSQTQTSVNSLSQDSHQADCFSSDSPVQPSDKSLSQDSHQDDCFSSFSQKQTSVNSLSQESHQTGSFSSNSPVQPSVNSLSQDSHQADCFSSDFQTQTSVNSLSQEDQPVESLSSASREDDAVQVLKISSETSETLMNEVTHLALPQLVHTSLIQNESIASVKQIDMDSSLVINRHQSMFPVEGNNQQSSTFLSLTDNDDENSDFSDGYEESDNVGMGQIGSLQEEPLCIKQEILEPETTILPSNQLIKNVHDLNEESHGLANTYSMLGYDKKLQVLDVQEFKCTDDNSVCSVKVLEVDARELTEQGFIDVFVIKNEKTQSSGADGVENAPTIDNVLYAVVKHESLESSSPVGDESTMLILENDDSALEIDSQTRITTNKGIPSKSCRCATCGRCFESREVLYHHRKTVHIKSNNRFKCQLCRNTYQTWSYLKKHHQRVHYNKEKARFKCSFCPEAFPQRHMLVMHVKKHTGQKDHVCDVCNKRFAELFVLNAHRKLVHFPEKLYECVQCQKKYKSFAGLKKHIVSHSGEKNHVCDCGKAFSTPESLLNHQKLHSDERPFVCPRCSKAFVLKGMLKKHIKRVHESVKTVDITKKPYVCDCGKRFAFESYLTNHIACYHSEFKPHLCSVCSKSFSKRYMLNKHVKREHPGTIPQTDNIPKQTIPCTECDKKFISRYHYNRHMKKFHPDEIKCSEVESEKPSTFVCHCGKEFSQERYLKCHLIVHDKVKPFACDSCDKSFSKLFKLNKHKKFVHMKKPKPVDPNKPFVCDCGKRFSNKRNLACHKITHKPRKDFKCPVCGKDFGANYLLNKHLRRVHEEDPNDYSDLIPK